MNRGMTLLELLIVLGVLGVLAALAAMNLSTYLQNARLNQARQEVAAALRAVSGRALSESQGYVVRFATGPTSHLKWSNRDGAGGELTLPHQVQIVTVTPATSSVSYTGRGFPVYPYRLGLRLGSGPVREVVVLPTGKVVTP